MRYTCEVIINLNRNEVINKFDNEENMYKWQESLKSYEIISGEKGKNGLKGKLVYDQRGKEMEMIETIELFDFPNQMIAIYEAKNVWNRCINTFEDMGGQTKWTMDTEFKMSGIIGVVGKFTKGMFMKQTQSDMEKFKVFAES